MAVAGNFSSSSSSSCQPYNSLTEASIVSHLPPPPPPRHHPQTNPQFSKLRLRSEIQTNGLNRHSLTFRNFRNARKISDTVKTVSFSCCASGDGHGSSSHESSSSSSDQGASPSKDESPWDLQSLQTRIEDMFSTATKRLQGYLDNYKGDVTNVSKVEEEPEAKESEEPNGVQLEDEWNWERWQKHFIHMEEQEKIVSMLKFELENAIHKEDFKEASRLKMTLNEAAMTDSVSEVLCSLKEALENESYQEAKQLRDEAAAGLVGWWVGLAEGESDPYGRIINISPSYGKFIAKGYTARQLANSASGIPLFEIFLRKDSDGYHQQTVYLQPRLPRDLTTPSSMDGNSDGNSSILDMNILTGDEKEIKDKDLTESPVDNEIKNRKPVVPDDGLNNIINFLKDRIPDVKLKVFNVSNQNGEDIPKIVEKILEEVEIEDNEGANSQMDSSEDPEDLMQEKKDKGRNDSELMGVVQREVPVRLIVGGMLQNVAEEKLPKTPTRVPARIETQSRDSFLLHIEETAAQLQSRESLLKVSAIMTKSSSDLPPEVVKAVSSLEKLPVKISKDMGELLKLAVSQVQKRHGLSKSTSFQRINFLDSDTEPFTGLYVGSFGPFTSELVQLRRKYGHWHKESNSSNSTEKLEFFEYVEAIKLTGDLNVPAGQVTFRAKIGKGSRLAHRGIYPEELGVIARYKGQGMLAEPGFKNPQWVDGDLLLLDGKGFGHLNGAELGFVYSVPERHFLVLFNRLKLQAKQ